MFCGRACHYERIEFRLDSAGAGGAYNGAGNKVGVAHYSKMRSLFDTATGPATGFLMYAGSSIGDEWPHGAEVEKAWYGGADGPWGSFSASGEDWRNVTVALTLFGFRAYGTADGVWRTRYDSAEVRVNGTLVGTGGPFDAYNTTFMSPNSVPVYAGCLLCEHDAQAAYVGATGYIVDQDAYCSAQGQGTFGVRWMVGGEWLTTPIAMPPRTAYASGEDSWSFRLESRTYREETRRHAGPARDCRTGDGTPYDTYMLTATAEEGGARSGFLFPNPPREVVRMNPEDYEALVLRYGSYGWENRLREHPNPADGGRSYLTDDYQVVHEPRAAYLARATGGGHVFEDLLHEPTRCWVSEGWSKSGPNGYLAIAPPGVTVLATDSALYPPCGSSEHDDRSFSTHPGDSRIYSFPARLTGAPVAANLGGWAPWGLYFNTLGSPHWSYFLYFPQGSEWKIGTAGIGREHWFPVRQQLVTHPDLPEGERTRHRVDVVAEPVDQNGLTGLIQSSSNMPCYWGVGRMAAQAVEAEPVAETGLPSLARWTFEDGTAVAGAADGVVLPEGQAKVSFRLGDWSVPPYELPHLAKAIESLVTDANVAGVKVWLVADDGTPPTGDDPGAPPTRVLIGEGKSGTWPMPKGASKKWITTAGYDGGTGWSSDTYDRIAPAEDDGTENTVGHGERNVTLGHTAATRTGVRVDWEVARVDGYEGDVVVRWPRFHVHPEGDLRLLRESPRHHAMLLPNGPVCRFGGGGYFDGVSVVPYLLPETGIALAPTVGDWLAHKRPWLLGKLATDGLAAEVAGIFESGVEYTQLKHLWADPFDGAVVTHSFLARDDQARPVALLVNSYGAVPPTGAMPTKKRSTASGWQATGTAGCYAYSMVASRKNVAAPAPVSVHLDGGGPDLLSADAALPAGWGGGWFVRAQEDAPRLFVRSGGKDWFKVRGWRGFLAILGEGPERGKLLAFLARHDGRLSRMVDQDGTVRLGATDVPGRNDWEEQGLGVGATDGGIARGVGQRRVLALVQDGACVLRIDASEGRQAPETTMTEGSATSADVCSFGEGVVLVARIDGGTVKTTLRSTKALALVDGPFDTNLTGLPEGAVVRVDDVRLGNNAPGVIALILADGDATSYLSTDGKTFA